MYIFFLIFLSIAFAYSAWRNVRFALIMLAALLPTYLIRFPVFGIPATFLEILLVLTVLVWCIQTSPRQLKKHLTSLPYRYIILVFVFAATLAVFVAPELRAALGVWKAYIIEPTLFYIVATVVLKKRDIPWIIGSLGISALLMSLVSTYQEFTGWGIPNPFWAAEETRRVTSFYGYPNALGLYAAPILILIFGWLMTSVQQRVKDGLYWITLFFQMSVLIFGIAAILFAESHGAVLALAAGLVFFGMLLSRRSAAITGAIILMGVGVLLLLPGYRIPLWEEVTLQGVSGEIRRMQWQETWAMLQERPLAGAGLSGYQAAVAPFHTADHIEVYLYPHTLIFNFWSEVGFVGMIALLGLWLFILVRTAWLGQGIAQRHAELSLDPEPVVQRRLLLAVSAAFTVMLVHGLVDVPYFKNDLSVLFWLMVAMSVVLQARIPSQQKLL